jgi:hypothetical protein
MHTTVPPSFFGISTKTVSFLVGVITLSTILLILSLGQEQSFGFLLEPSSHMDMIQTTLSSSCLIGTTIVTVGCVLFWGNVQPHDNKLNAVGSGQSSINSHSFTTEGFSTQKQPWSEIS